MPLADRGPGTTGFLLLRRQGGHGHAVLRLSQPDRLPAGGGPPPRTAGGAIRVSTPPLVRRCQLKIRLLRRRQPTEGGCFVPPARSSAIWIPAPCISRESARRNGPGYIAAPASPRCSRSSRSRSPWTSSTRIAAT